MIVSIDDHISAWIRAHHTLSLNSTLDTVARVRSSAEGEQLRRLGGREVVCQEMEVGLEILRHSPHRYRTSRGDMDLMVSRLRDHLSFGTVPEAQEALPTEGLGSDLRSPDPPCASS